MAMTALNTKESESRSPALGLVEMAAEKFFFFFVAFLQLTVSHTISKSALTNLCLLSRELNTNVGILGVAFMKKTLTSSVSNISLVASVLKTPNARYLIN